MTNAPVNAGTYTATATVTDPNYTGSNAATLTIAKAVALVTISGTSQPYTGSPMGVTVGTVPGNLATIVTYNGFPSLPSALGTYSVLAAVSEANYAGSNTATLVIYDPVARWRSNAYGTTNNSGGAADSAIGASGLSNLEAYALGIDPSKPSTSAPLTGSASNGTNFILSFTARAAGTNAGYSGLTRYYTLEGSTNPGDSNSWRAVAGYSNIPAADQTVTFSTNTTNATRSFYRLRVWLQ